MLVLASASPRRKELLSQIGYDFRVVPSDIPEIRHPGETPAAFVGRLAYEKAKSVFGRLQQELTGERLVVLGADTIVLAAEEVLGKPRDTQDAVRMLRLLSERIHQVITGVCLFSNGSTEVAIESTWVEMREIADTEIAEYVATGEPMDKAGAYAIQGYAARWIPRIQGCYFNVVGLPLALVSGLIERQGLNPRVAAVAGAPATKSRSIGSA